MFCFTVERFVDIPRSQALWITEINKVEFNNSKCILGKTKLIAQIQKE